VSREDGLDPALRQQRLSTGLSQRLAERPGVPQPNIAASERVLRTPAADTLQRLHAVLDVPTLRRVRDFRESLTKAAQLRALSNVRVFGSVAREDATVDSDVDLLVHPSPDSSIFDLAGFMVDVAELLGTKVDVVSDRGTGPAMARIRAEAVPL
jgi:predicted nucleotidyltransferase